MSILDYLGNSTSSTSSFHCPHCGKHTPHNKMTLSEWAAINNPKDTIGAVSAGFFDIFHLTSIVNVAGISHWKCCNCGLTTIRKSNGAIDTIGKTSK